MDPIVKDYKFKVWDAYEFSQREFPEPEWLIPEIVPGAGNNLIYAHGKIGKSILTIQLCHALTYNEPFLGVKPGRTFKVLWVQCDLPEREWAIQMKRLGDAPNGIPWTKGWTTIWETKGLFMETLKLASLGRYFKSEGYDVLILDSILALAGDVDLNNPVVARRQFDKVDGIVGPKPSWIIHHSRKGMAGVPDHASTAATGSGQITAGASTLFYLKDKGMEIRGRYIERQFSMGRIKNGIWIPAAAPKKDDPYDIKPS